VLLQEFGRAGRKEDMIVNPMLYFNEYIDDKCLGLWLKSLLDSTISDEAYDITKDEMISNYMCAWNSFIQHIMVSACHGNCPILWWDR